ncbi:hypothetical protein VKI21_18425 [Cyanobacterium aponinum UTEX 3222]|uniref:hypothetical protein n=1 Tax=Cyanobacterium aponinum TaxID=379064 RepID=UPI002B4BB134|nr:hypothetical protein [Cyanobacterium aponinum]WRL38394.1 hypothetical protein VKI22_17545 [Cyanobacterium aponinum UTEX 3221]WRL41987.1 hypothetical protein VKI21_18425 [Cyanobacterium aponinum UTEX 3222]
MINFSENIVDESHMTSKYIPLICFKDQEQREIIDNYILKEAEYFFSLIKVNIDVETNFLFCFNLITDKEFQTIDIKYFYENILNNIQRNSEEKLEHQPKWGVTFDNKCTPMKLAYVSPNYTGNNPKLNYENNKGKPFRNFGTFEINDQPIFYYLYFTMQEILDAIRDNE